MSALGENKIIFEYLHETLISYKSNFVVKVDSEEEIAEWTKEWEYTKGPLKGIDEININWGVNSERTEMSSETIIDIQKTNIEDFPEGYDDILLDLINDKDVFDWEQTKELFEVWGFSCQ